MMNSEEEFLESLEALESSVKSSTHPDIYIDESEECIKRDFLAFIENIRHKYEKDIYLHVNSEKWKNLSAYVRQIGNLDHSLPDYNDYFRIKDVSDEEFADLE